MTETQNRRAIEGRVVPVKTELLLEGGKAHHRAAKPLVGQQRTQERSRQDGDG